MKVFLTVVFLAIIGAIAWHGYNARITFTFKKESPPPAEVQQVVQHQGTTTKSPAAVLAAATSTKKTTVSTSTNIVLTNDQLLALADNKFENGDIPLGDDRYSTTGPKTGYVYLCNVHKDNPGSMVNGPWIHGTTWNYLNKISVDGSVTWPNATFSNKVSGSQRMIGGNGLPVGHTTGTFPVASTDDAAKYDKNPNTISIQKLSKQFPANPAYSETPYCMGGEVGVMLTGVPLFNAFDAGLRDAPAHELQDSCDGHPQGSGVYHYHSLSACFKDIGVSTVLGYALDGFPITGPKVADKKYLTSEDLDVCHGITSDVLIDGKKKTTYHYVMTRDFPYSASCFRAKPLSLMVIQGAGPQGQGAMPPANQQQGVSQGTPPGPQGTQGGTPPTPPQEAIIACSGHTKSDSCSFATPDGTQISGHCDTPPGQSSLACVPR